MQAQGAPAMVSRASEFPEGLALKNAKSLLGEARRGFFTSATSWTASAAGKTAEMVIRKNLGMKAKDATLREQLGAGASGTLPQFQERRRSQVLDAMDRLGEPAVEQVETRLFGRVEIDASVCNSCGMCAVLLPLRARSAKPHQAQPQRRRHARWRQLPGVLLCRVRAMWPVPGCVHEEMHHGKPAGAHRRAVRLRTAFYLSPETPGQTGNLVEFQAIGAHSAAIFEKSRRGCRMVMLIYSPLRKRQSGCGSAW